MITRTKTRAAAAVILLVAVLAAAGFWSSTIPPNGPAATPAIRSITFESRRVVTPAHIEAVGRIGVSHLTLIPFAHQRGVSSAELRFSPDTNWFTESDRGIRQIARTADSLGLGLILKPHIWVGGNGGAGQTRDQVGFDSEDAWLEWEASYRTYLLHHARLAASVDADILVVGTELRRSARERESFWRELIAEVRGIFPGHLTYAANWWMEYREIAFWDDLDFIGVQGYFPVSEDESPDMAQLVRGWAPHRDSLAAISNRFDRPVLFTEVGYRSATGAAREPWAWAPRHADEAIIDTALQARLYEAFFQAMWGQSWFAGAVFWKWTPDPGSGERAERWRRRRLIDFTPQNKPAQQVLERWFRSRS